MVDTFRRPPRGGVEEEQLGFLLFRMDGLILTNIHDRWEEVATRWVKVMPIKINVFAWRVSLDKLPTRLNLSLKDYPSLLRSRNEIEEILAMVEESDSSWRAIIEELERLPGNLVACKTREHLKRILKAVFVEVKKELRLFRVVVIEKLWNILKVCRDWRKICKEPSMWRVIYMDSYQHSDCWPYPWPSGLPVTELTAREMCKNVVDRSQGQLVDITMVGFCDDELLEYVADRYVAYHNPFFVTSAYSLYVNL
ncbi:RNA-directed DNA polymerase, eukaryota [Tanacetum coccineum]